MASWEDNLRQIEPYVPGEQPQGKDIVKLNTNENPYPPAPEVEKIIKEFKTEDLKKYPDTTAQPLVEALSEYYGFEENEIFVGVGSDDVLAMAFMAFFNSDKPILFPEISYSFYEVWADLFRIPYTKTKLNEDFTLQKEEFFKENGGIVIANPNAPTSIAEPLEFIEDVLKYNQASVVIVDEAYVDFGGNSALSLLNKYNNLLVVQTFSKSRSMAGARIGFAIGSKKLISTLNAVKNSYNSYTMNMVSYLAGREAVLNKAYFEDRVNAIIKTRENCKKSFKELGFTMPDSKTNFLFVKHDRVPAAEIYEKLRQAGIYVRYFKKPRIDNYLRITIGTDEEMNKLLGELKKILGGK